MKSKKFVLIICAIIIVGLLIVAYSVSTKPKDRTTAKTNHTQVQIDRLKDTEFNLGTKIKFNILTDTEINNLTKLAKVWGFVKYKHPSITKGDINWDAELFRVMPSVMKASSSKDANKVILDWLNKFPVDEQKVDSKTKDNLKKIEKNNISKIDLSWIKNKEDLGDDLSSYLQKLDKIVVTNFLNGYTTYALSDEDLTISNEFDYPSMSYDDSGLRLLGLFRYWNIIEYFYPYKDSMNENWDAILSDMIPKFVEGDDKQSYNLLLAELSSHIHDSNVYVYHENDDITSHFGKYKLPVKYINLDGKIIVTYKLSTPGLEESSFELGDVILSIDGVDVDKQVEDCKKYISLSDEERFAYMIDPWFLRTQNEKASVKILRDNKEQTIEVTCGESYVDSSIKITRKIENDKIGYINAGMLGEKEIFNVMEDFKDTEGIILDLRHNPTYDITYQLAAYLMKKPVEFYKYGYSNKYMPGCFNISDAIECGGDTVKYDNIKQYKGKFVILMNEGTLNKSELTIMALKNADNVTLVGSKTGGSFGDTVSFMLPGQVKTQFSGHSMFSLKDKQMGHEGIKPDVEVIPTIEGIKAEKDEVLEKAISIIMK